MSALFLLVGVSLLVALGFLGAFIWSVRDGQYDDDYTPSVRMLFENKRTQSANPALEKPAVKTNESLNIKK